MRGLAVAAAMLALSACGDRRTFDQRYEDTNAKLEEKAKALDANLSANIADGNGKDSDD